MLKEFINFDRLITGEIIKYLFWIGAAISVLMGIIAFLTGIVTGEFLGALFGLIFIIIGPLIVRIYCEIAIVFFKIYEVLKEINEK
ncbi:MULTISPECIES: DUF4282 domain-containing protein [Lysinibacillus]|uniref:DUF4282 domain-containing protein n=1 Tax=Lysinibacillus antri TaxID=2498145 RepID=A0A432LI72_9BACI|nr:MULTISPECIES: DUF4282 domain-containing protein [Lysinibacillus]RUL56952.1 DUF4282 domain-containing protein [Lysinibacillus antri]TSI08559.1 DUF4282 domain-containing protein [Lysinibacillus sp. BW-2-10]